jgi:glycolate oxidase
LADGAVPLRRGIIVDVKLMNTIHDIDLVDRTVTVGPGINMLKLNEELRRYGVIYPDDPASYPCSLVGGRIGTSGWSLIGGRYGHVRDLVISMQWVLPNGEIVEIGDGGGRKIRKSSTGYSLKHLFMGAQGTLGIVTQATLELVPRPEVEFSPFFAYPDFASAYESTGALAKSGLATLAGVVLFDEWKLRYLRRDLAGRLGRAPRSLRHAAAWPAAQRAGCAHELALRGRLTQLQRAARGARGVARHRRSLHHPLRRLRRLGHVLLHQRRLQAMG